MPARLLIVDDDVWVLKMLQTVLEKHGYTIDVAHNGAEALDRVDDCTPDLIITDVTMPKMDGWTLVRILRARPETAFTPVIFLTALGSDEDRIQGFRLGADDYMQKPFHFQEFDLRVRSALRRAQGARETAKATVEEPPKAGVHGSLDQLGLSSLLVMLEMEKKSGILRLTRNDEVAQLYFHSGRVIKAVLEGKDEPKGAKAVFHVLSWTTGHFGFTQQTIDQPDEVNSSTTHLLMEGARRMDEANRT